MTRWSLWARVASAVVGVLAARVLWLGWLYDFNNGPRYRVESAVMAMIIVGTAVMLARSSDERRGHQDPAEPPQPLGRFDLSCLRWLPVFLIAAACLYGPALGIGLLSDDYTLRAMAQSDGLGAGSGWFFRPLPLLLWHALLAVTNSAVLLHIVNVLLHGLNAFLVAALGLAMGMRRAVSFGGAALFLTFPAAPEAVVWAAGIQDVLMTTMALGAVVATRAVTLTAARIAGICSLTILGLGSKETAICIPALVAICWMTPSRLRRWRGWPLYIALILVTGVYLAIRVPMGLSSGYLVAPSRYFFKQLVVTAFGTLSTPWRAPASGADQVLAFVALAIVVLLLTHAFLSWRGSDARLHRDLRLAGWVLVAVAPVFTFFFISPQLEGSRYLYLAECGWALLIADLVAAATDRMPARLAAFVCAIGVAVVVSALSLEREIGVWARAADLRDRALAEAHAAIARQGCVEATFADVPDSVDGAYVFRNGFREAMAPTKVRLKPDTTAEADTESAAAACDLVWRDGQFIPRRP